jgi:hypothetical protein
MSDEFSAAKESMASAVKSAMAKQFGGKSGANDPYNTGGKGRPSSGSSPLAFGGLQQMVNAVGNSGGYPVHGGPDMEDEMQDIINNDSAFAGQDADDVVIAVDTEIDNEANKTGADPESVAITQKMVQDAIKHMGISNPSTSTIQAIENLFARQYAANQQFQQQMQQMQQQAQQGTSQGGQGPSTQGGPISSGQPQAPTTAPQLIQGVIPMNVIIYVADPTDEAAVEKAMEELQHAYAESDIQNALNNLNHDKHIGQIQGIAQASIRVGAPKGHGLDPNLVAEMGKMYRGRYDLTLQVASTPENDRLKYEALGAMKALKTIKEMLESVGK